MAVKLEKFSYCAARNKKKCKDSRATMTLAPVAILGVEGKGGQQEWI